MKTALFRRDSAAPARGFTMIEFAVTMFVATSLMAIAAPSFVKYTASQQLRNASYDLMAAMQLARSEAIKRNTNVDVVRSGSNWAGGWRVVTGATTLRRQDAYPQVIISDSANLTKLTYSNDGRPATSTTTFKMQPTAAAGDVTAYCVKLLLSGTASSTRGGC